MKKRSLFVLSIFIGIALLLAACGPDRQLGYQAVLTGPGGIPVANGNYIVIVKFWDDPTATGAGNLIYSDTQTVAVTNGMLNVAIPDLVSEADNLDPALFSRPLWVELTIKGEKLSPRQKLLGTPYAYTLVGGALISTGPAASDVAPLIAAAPERGALTIGNSYASADPDSPGATGLVVTIVDDGSDGSNSDVIRACSGNISCLSADVVFRVRGNGQTQSDSWWSPAADFAEMIKAEGSAAGLEPGDVLVISSTQDRAVAKSLHANDPFLAGVYSTKPGFIGGSSMGDDQPGFVPVAIMGIVPVKVTAANGPIHRGDLLTSSNIPGYAMLATNPLFGAILGKAMGELLEGEGVIQVLLLLK